MPAYEYVWKTVNSWLQSSCGFTYDLLSKSNGYNTQDFCIELAKMDISGVIEKLSNNWLCARR